MKKTYVSTGKFFYFHRYGSGGGFVLDIWKFELRVQWIFRFELYFKIRDDLDFEIQTVTQDEDMVVPVKEKK